jgi:pyridoxine 4-dehydrogenase
MSETATSAGTFAIGGDLEITRLGYGAMRVTGDGIWGPPPDRDAAIAVLKRLPDLGVDFIDTADSYGPEDSENLIHEALHPFDGMHVATKGGFTRHGPNLWAAVGRPEYLRQCCLMSLRRLGLEAIDLWQLHRIDPKVPREEQFGLMKELQDEGKVRHLGLSEVSVEEIKAAREVFDVATVQNLYNLSNRRSEDVLDYCGQRGSASFRGSPWRPAGSASRAVPWRRSRLRTTRRRDRLPSPGCSPAAP